MLGEQVRNGAPHQRYEVLGPHDDTGHRRSQALLSEVQGEEREQAGFGTRAQEGEGAGQSEGTFDVYLLVPLHDCFPVEVTVCPNRFHMEQLIGSKLKDTHRQIDTQVKCGVNVTEFDFF